MSAWLPNILLIFLVVLPISTRLFVFGIIFVSISNCVDDNAPLNVVAVIVPAAKLPEPSLATTLLAVFVVVASTAISSALAIM